jgi:hypothetical protein
LARRGLGPSPVSLRGAGYPGLDGCRGQPGKIFPFPGVNVVLLTGVRDSYLRFLEKPQAIKGGVGRGA